MKSQCDYTDEQFLVWKLNSISFSQCISRYSVKLKILATNSLSIKCAVFILSIRVFKKCYQVIKKTSFYTILNWEWLALVNPLDCLMQFLLTIRFSNSNLTWKLFVKQLRFTALNLKKKSHMSKTQEFKDYRVTEERNPKIMPQIRFMENKTFLEWFYWIIKMDSTKLFLFSSTAIVVPNV